MTGADILERLCVHQLTLNQCDFRGSVECLARHGIYKTAVWHEKLEGIEVAEARRILNGEGVQATSYCAGGFFADQDPEGFDRAVTRNRRQIEQAAGLGARSIVMISGGLPEGSRDLEGARQRAAEGFSALVGTARAAGVTLGLEPLHPMVCGLRSVWSTLDDAAAVLDSLGAPDVTGLVLDTYALWWDTRLSGQIERLGSRVVNFHVSDWLRDTRDVRLDRGMPGDGVIDLPAMRAALENSGFGGDVEIEILSQDRWWKRDPDEVIGTILDRVRAAV